MASWNMCVQFDENCCAVSGTRGVFTSSLFSWCASKSGGTPAEGGAALACKVHKSPTTEQQEHIFLLINLHPATFITARVKLVCNSFTWARFTFESSCSNNNGTRTIWELPLFTRCTCSAGGRTARWWKKRNTVLKSWIHRKESWNEALRSVIELRQQQTVRETRRHSDSLCKGTFWSRPSAKYTFVCLRCLTQFPVPPHCLGGFLEDTVEERIICHQLILMIHIFVWHLASASPQCGLTTREKVSQKFIILHFKIKKIIFRIKIQYFVIFFTF